ncbi:Ca2/Mn2 transporting P-type ATPase P5 type Cta5 [Schizosaccharomyces japonicus yFS275]|uniref:Cation-transporting ATPase n=1 Tax=Schizosaccharomyces japonicus (strain yFS275 / FY16936) TaxID=402676 RepID=B6K7P0_SCHJY|nr:Ca2/Mn2 transporting P-type ATPase P5 type Cta5 [Schizosaccharomyces japonicus yFS275]EEB09544.1 Ca2/Mn2 transporting P-type ATPase P5 type Cta5 [Schizosaccharomyces japonicus yFS275]
MLFRSIQKPYATIELEDIDEIYSPTTNNVIRQQRLSLETIGDTVLVDTFQLNEKSKNWLEILNFCTLGFSYVLTKWKPSLYLKALGAKCTFSSAKFVAIYSMTEKCTIIQPVISVTPQFTFSDGILTFPSNSTVKYFEYKRQVFYLNPKTLDWQEAMYEKIAYHIFSTSKNYVANGLSTCAANSLSQICQTNVTRFKASSFLSLITKEVCHPVYFFEIFSVCLWLLDHYVLYASCVFILTAYSVVLFALDNRASEEHIARLVGPSQSVRVIRDGQLCYIQHEDLVIGDLVVLQGSCKINFDGILISGTCLLNDSFLTGESVPVNKLPVVSQQDPSFEDAWEDASSDVLSAHAVHSGTLLLKTSNANPNTEPFALAIVIRTGFVTRKGKLLLSMLYGRVKTSSLQRDSYAFLKAMIIFAAVMFLVTMSIMHSRGYELRLILLRALDLITIIVPPALPMSLNMGLANASRRLSKKKITVTDPKKFPNAGSISVVGFDKTGTLTDDTLTFESLFISSKDSTLISTSLEDLKTDAVLTALKIAIACHSLSRENNELVGDPLESALFNGFNGILDNDGPNVEITSALLQNRFSSSIDPKVSILKTFEFSPQLRRMSVIAHASFLDCVEVYAKGAVEAIVNICSQETVPDSLMNSLNALESKGLRVLAFASKQLDFAYYNCKQWNRSGVESNLTFGGLYVFRSQLKPTAKSVVKSLLNNGIEVYMASGDSLLTSKAVAADIGFFDENKVIYTPSINQNTLRWLRHTTEDNDLPTESLVEQFQEQDTIHSSSIAVVMTGSDLRYLINLLPAHELQRVLQRCKVFGRMSPSDKELLVSSYQNFGLKVAFCGDGANDCLALQKSDAGLSLSVLDTCAAATFISEHLRLKDMIEVIIEGRCATVTGYSCFQFVILSAILQFIGVLCLYVYNFNFSDGQFLTMDLFVIYPLSATISSFHPTKQLSKCQPPDRLFTVKFLKTIATQSLSAFLANIITLNLVLSLEPKLPQSVPETSNTQNALTTAMFFLSLFHYIGAAFAVNKFTVFRQRASQNVLFLSVVTLIFLPCILLCFGTPSSIFTQALSCVTLQFTTRLLLLLCSISSAFILYIIQDVY